MKSKEFVLDDQTSFTVTKRRSSRHLRISLSTSGDINVSIPTYVPYSAAISFVKSREQWISQHRPTIRIFTNGMAIGKSHHLFLQPTTTQKITSRLKDTEAILSYPQELDRASNQVQKAAKTLVTKALRIQAQNLMPIRTAALSKQYGFSFQELRYRNLKNRWGSCDQKGNLTFNIYLMELPWELIDYVILHELNHTKYLNHSSDFWNHLETLLPNAKELRKQIKNHRAHTV